MNNNLFRFDTMLRPGTILNIVIPLDLLSYKIPSDSFFHFSVSKLGSDRSVCRKCKVRMHLRIIHYEYDIVNQS